MIDRSNIQVSDSTKLIFFHQIKQSMTDNEMVCLQPLRTQVHAYQFGAKSLLDAIHTVLVIVV